MIPIFVGYDSKEALSYSVLTNSIARHSASPVSITPLKLSNLTFYNETHTDGSTEFSYSRFLVPYMMNYQGWAIYMDSDMLVTEDITNLWNLRDESLALLCVQHEYKTQQDTKMWGVSNRNYNRKNWSSMMLINCAHTSMKAITPAVVESSSGAYLHQFSWLAKELIGSIPDKWNWLADEYGENYSASLIHYTLGSPALNKNTPMSDLWFNELKLITNEYDQQF